MMDLWMPALAPEACKHCADMECADCPHAAAEDRAEETPLGEELDGMNDDVGDMYPPEDDDVSQGRYDDDPNPYSGE